VRGLAKASTAGSIEGSGDSRGLFRRAFVTRGVLGDVDGSGARSSRMLALGVLLIASLTALLAAAPAQADPAVRTYKSTNVVFPTSPTASRVAVDQGTGNILVSGGSSIVVRDRSGAQLTTFAVPGPGAPATDPGTGAVYYAEASGTITRYTSDGAPTPTYTADGTFTSPPIGSGVGEIAAIAGIAVDPSTHDVLIVDPSNDRVSRISPSGTYLSDFPAGASSPSGGFAAASGISAGPSGEILVVAAGHVDRFTAAGVPEGELTGVSSPSTVAINPTTGGILVAGGGGLFAVPDLYFYDDSGALPAAASFVAPAPGIFFGSWPLGVGVDGSTGRAYGLYQDAGNAAETLGLELLDPAVKPGVELAQPSQVESRSMHLHGTVDSGENGKLPAGVAEGSAHFVLSAPGVPTVQTPDQSYTATAGLQEIDADVGGLVPNSTYSVTLVAQNSQLSNESATLTATTDLSAPTAETSAATDITDSSAVLHGAVAAYGLQTTYYFEYGTTAGYGGKAPAGAPGVFGVSYASRPVQRTIEGLEPGVTYHYRLVATNSAGTTFGDDKTFMASSGGQSRGYEMVTPPEKAGGDLFPGFGFQAGSDGGTITFVASSGFGNIEASGEPYMPLYLSRRGSSGWEAPKALDPPVDTHRPDIAAQYFTLGVSDDGSRALVISNRKLTPDALEVDNDGVDLYIRDTSSGAYTFVGGSADPRAFSSFTELGHATNFLGGNADFSAVVFGSPVPLTADELTGTGSDKYGIYRWSASGLELISRMPNGSIASGVLQRTIRAQTQMVSADARRVVFTVYPGYNGLVNQPPQSDGGGVFLWEGGQTRAISVLDPGDPDTVQPGVAAGISSDGKYVTFSMVDSDLPPNNEGVYPEGIYRLDLSGGGTGSLGSVADRPAGVVAVSADGSHVYFEGKPTPADPAGAYVWSPGSVRYVTQLIAEGAQRFVSPNGRYFAFASASQLTPFDNQGREQVYYYDAADGELSCASCPRDGSLSIGTAQLPDTEVAESNRYPRSLIDDGQVFFHTTTPLVAADLNELNDVYSFRDGQATLISPGGGPYEAQFADASADGRDVFIYTDQRIASRDTDTGFDLYDARVGGGEAEREAFSRCGGDECAEPVSAAPPPPPVATQTSAGRTAKAKRRAKHHRRHHRSRAKKAGAKKQSKRTAHRTVHVPRHSK
jgi:hypothetical protein